MNRYSNITTSDFNPLSLEEVLAVPLYKQKQYDALEEARIKQADMFKIDPLDVHKERAMELNNSYMSKVDELANYQARTGDIQGSKSRMIKLQREYKKLNDPMGEVSKTNGAKVAYNAEKARFLEAATKQYGSEQALKLWNDHSAKYTGFNDKNEITNIDSRGLVKAKDFDKELVAYHSLLGSINSEIGTSGNRIVDAGQGDGSKKMVNSSNRVVKSSNVDALNSMKKAMSADWLTPNGEGYKFNQEAGVDNAVFNAKFTNLMESQIQNTYKNIADSSASYIAAPTVTSPDPGNNSSSSVYDTVTLDGNGDSLKNISKIGTTLDKTIPIDPKDPESVKAIIRAQNAKIGKKFVYTDLPEFEQKVYMAEYNRLLKANRIKKAFQDPNNTQTAAFVKQQLVKNPITISNRAVETDVAPNNLGFPSTVDSKNANARDSYVVKSLTNASRQLLDPETGVEISLNKFAEKYAKDGKVSNLNIKFDRQMSPMNVKDLKFGNSKQNVAPDVISYEDDKGKVHTAFMSKDRDYLNSNNGRADELINKVYNDITINYGDARPINHPSFKGVTVKYLPTQDAVILNIPSEGELPPMSLNTFNKLIYSTKL